MAEAGPRYLLPFDTFRLPHHLTDVLVVGTGGAGYTAALAAAEAGARVLLLAKGDPADSNTAWAQGGVAAVMEEGADSPSEHAEDTLAVGQGLCDEALVREVTGEARASIERLIELGAHFDTVDPAPGESEGRGRARGLEAAHSHPRVLHARGDATGAEIRDTLAQAVARSPRVKCWAHAFLVDLLTDGDGRCVGALVHSRGHLRAVWAGAVVLATGGYAQVYRESSNWPGATGDGLAAAWRAGAGVQDLEFVQFHPTTLYLAGVPRLLITEAVRGEGAWIVDDRGRRFLSDADGRGELAPRDVISRAIMRHLMRPEVTGVFLDLTHLDAARVARRFPGVARSCLQHGLDVARDRIPIRPAAHYTIGGVRTDRVGATEVVGLFAAGEVAGTGMHGANRLASNSLLEGLVLGRRAGEAAAAFASGWTPGPLSLKGEGTGGHTGFLDADDLRASLKAVLWREAGIERTGGLLTGAHAAVAAWERFARQVGPPSIERLTLLNMLLIGRLLTASALLREESRGTHYRRDFPERDDEHFRVRIVHRRDRDPQIVPLPPLAVAAAGHTPAREVD
jgi:L-aspartate oxidase